MDVHQKRKSTSKQGATPYTARAFPHGDRRADREEGLPQVSSYSGLAQVALAPHGICRQVGGASRAGLNGNQV